MIEDTRLANHYLKNINKWIVSKINKTVNSSFYNEIKWIWIFGDDELVIKKLSEKYPNLLMWQELDKEMWIIYLTSIVNLKKTDEFQHVFKTYSVKYPNDNEIKNYLPLANYLYNLNQNNYKTSSSIFNMLNLNESILKRLILNAKSIAIVGNGSAHLNKGLGKTIDNHDLVIRFNNFKTDGFENDYGCKTNIWVRGCASNDLTPPKDIENIDFVVFSADYMHFKVHYDDLEYMQSLIEKGIKITNLNTATHVGIKKSSGILFPTTGLLFIWYVYMVKKSINNVSLFGFGFQSNSISIHNEHYFEKRNLGEAINRAKVHDMAIEAAFIYSLVSKK